MLFKENLLNRQEVSKDTLYKNIGFVNLKGRNGINLVFGQSILSHIMDANKKNLKMDSK